MARLDTHSSFMLAHEPCGRATGCGGGGGLLPAGRQRLPLECWLPSMLSTGFFAPCEHHREHKKCEATYFCADCGLQPGPLCTHCLGDHVGHRVIQIRRYVYCDVVRACDMAPHMDVSGVQTYIINQAKVMFLNQRQQSKLGRPGAPDACTTCARTLREGCSFCSIACKLSALVAAGRLPPPAGGCAAAAAAAANVMQQHRAAMAAAGDDTGRHATGGSASDSSECWGLPAGIISSGSRPATNASRGAAQRGGGGGRRGAAALQLADDDCAGMLAGAAAGEAVDGGCSGDSSSSWGGGAATNGCTRAGAAALALARRHSDSDSDGRYSSGGLCSRRKQPSPRRSPLL